MSFCKKVFFILFFLVFWGNSISYSQTFSIQQYTTEDGLPGSTAYSIIQDKNRMLWIATDGGVCKFDGLDFQPLKDENLQGEMINLFYDSKDRLWMIDLALQASFLDLKNGTISRNKGIIPNSPINAIIEDPLHNYWFLHPQKVSVLINSDTLEGVPTYREFNKETTKGKKDMNRKKNFVY